MEFLQIWAVAMAGASIAGDGRWRHPSVSTVARELLLIFYSIGAFVQNC
jgi:hypothetical protein